MQSPIFKIVDRKDWESARSKGEFAGAAVDLQDGFIHFSTALQVRETAEKHFSGQSNLLLIAVDPDALDESLRWEPSRGGDLFPHLYGNLPFSAVVEEFELPWDGEKHQFPATATGIGGKDAT